MTPEKQEVKRRKKLAFILVALAIVLSVVAIIWWGNLADSDIEDGPVKPVEAIADSADDRR